MDVELEHGRATLIPTSLATTLSSPARAHSRTCASVPTTTRAWLAWRATAKPQASQHREPDDV